MISLYVKESNLLSIQQQQSCFHKKSHILTITARKWFVFVSQFGKQKLALVVSFSG